jgi:hypothetical protein
MIALRRQAMAQPEQANDDSKKGTGHNTKTGAREILNTLAQMQLASLATSSALLSQWTVCTIRHGEQVSKILRTLAQSQENYGAAAREVLDVYRKYLQQTISLSSTADLRFYSELDKIRHTITSRPTTNA